MSNFFEGCMPYNSLDSGVRLDCQAETRTKIRGIN